MIRKYVHNGIKSIKKIIIKRLRNPVNFLKLRAALIFEYT